MCSNYIAPFSYLKSLLLHCACYFFFYSIYQYQKYYVWGCVCKSVCVHMRVHMDVTRHLFPMWMPQMELRSISLGSKYAYLMDILLALHLYLEIVFHWPQRSLIQLRWLASKCLGSTCFCLSSARIYSLCHGGHCFLMCLGISWACQTILSIELSPQPHLKYPILFSTGVDTFEYSDQSIFCTQSMYSNPKRPMAFLTSDRHHSSFQKTQAHTG